MADWQFSLLLVPTLRCNADCDYCFEHKTEDLMSLENLEKIVRLVFDHMDRTDAGELMIYWQGGEVFTIPVEWMKRANEIISTAAMSRNKGIRHRIQSNMIGYAPVWNGILDEMFGKKIGSSLDFPNLYRRTLGGRPEEFNDLWLERVKEARANGMEVAIITLPNKASLEVGGDAFYSYLTEVAGMEYFQLNTPFPGWNKSYRDELILDTERFSQFIIDLSEVWLARGYGAGVRISPFDEFINYFRTGECCFSCVWHNNCVNRFIAVGPNGNTAQCDTWVASVPEYSYGNILECDSLTELLESDNRRKLRERPKRLMQQHGDCVDCDYLAICHGGCAIRTYSVYSTPYAKDPYCEVFKRMFAHMEKLAFALAAEGRHGDVAVSI